MRLSPNSNNYRSDMGDRDGNFIFKIIHNVQFNYHKVYPISGCAHLHINCSTFRLARLAMAIKICAKKKNVIKKTEIETTILLWIQKLQNIQCTNKISSHELTEFIFCFISFCITFIMIIQKINIAIYERLQTINILYIRICFAAATTAIITHKSRQ